MQRAASTADGDQLTIVPNDAGDKESREPVDILYVLNHADEERTVDVPFDYTELITGETRTAGSLPLPKKGVAIIRRRND